MSMFTVAATEQIEVLGCSDSESTAAAAATINKQPSFPLLTCSVASPTQFTCEYKKRLWSFLAASFCHARQLADGRLV